MKQIEIDRNRYNVSYVKLSRNVANKLRKNSKKKSSYASNKIEGNPLSERQVDEAIESDDRKHFLKPEQEVRNYFLALNFWEDLLYCTSQQFAVGCFRYKGTYEIHFFCNINNKWNICAVFNVSIIKRRRI